MVKKNPAKKTKEKRVDPNAFYVKPEGEYHQPPKSRKLNISDKVKEKVITREEPIPTPFNEKKYKEKANRKLEDVGAGVRVYHKSSVNMLITVLIGVIIVFGLFFVWSVSNDKFKTDFTCPDLTCEKAELSCPAPALIPDCVCSQNFTCATVNNSDIINAINNLNISSVGIWNSSN